MGKVIAEGGGNPRCGVLILRDVLPGRRGRDAEARKAEEDKDGAGGEYAWGLYPFCSVGLSVSNMGAILAFSKITTFL